MSGSSAVTPREGWLPVAEGLDLYYRVYGQGEAVPVICLPGYWRTSRDFEELAAHLSPGRRVVLVDLRGRGRSGRSTDSAAYAFDLLVADVRALLEAVGIARAVFVGLALGAEIAIEIAGRFPELVAGIVLNDSAPEANPDAGKRMQRFAGGGELTRDEAVARVRAQYAADFPRLTDRDVERLVYRNYAQTADGAYVRDFDQLTNTELIRRKTEHPTLWDEFDRIGEIPIVLLRGGNSDYVTPEIAARVVARRPGVALHTIPDTGHPVLLWEPEAFAAIDALLHDVDARG